MSGAKGSLFAALEAKASTVVKSFASSGTAIDRYIKAIDMQIANIELAKSGKPIEGRAWFFEKNGKYYIKPRSLLIAGKPTLEVGPAGDYQALTATFELLKSAIRANEGDLQQQINEQSAKVGDRLKGTRGPRKPK